MMKSCVYAIFSHINPDQVLRLVRTLRMLSPGAHIVVHHDPSYTTLKPEEVQAAGGVAIPDPIRAEWGDYSQVEQHLHTMRWCHDHLDFEWYVTLTGQTYPIKPPKELESFLNASACHAYVTYFDAYDPLVWPKKEAARRYHYRYIKVPRFRYWHRIPKAITEIMPSLIRWLNNIQPVLQIFTFPRSLSTRLGWRTLNRPFSPKNLPLIAGNQNTNFRKGAITRILEFVDANPAYVEYFSKTSLPDEVFFTTIVVNSPGVNVNNQNLRYIYWPKDRPANVGFLDLSHLDDIESSFAFFALKFDQKRCPELLDYFDGKLGISTGNASD